MFQWVADNLALALGPERAGSVHKGSKHAVPKILSDLKLMCVPMAQRIKNTVH